MMFPLLPGQMPSRQLERGISGFLKSLRNDSLSGNLHDMNMLVRFLSSNTVDCCMDLLFHYVTKFCAIWEQICSAACANFTSTVEVVDDMSLELVQVLQSIETKSLDSSGFKKIFNCIFDVLNLSTNASNPRPDLCIRLNEHYLNLILSFLDSIYLIAINSLFKTKDLRFFFAENCVALISKIYSSLEYQLREPQMVLVEDKMSSFVKLFLYDNESIDAITYDVNRFLSLCEGECADCTYFNLPIFDSLFNSIADCREDVDLNSLKAINFILRTFTLASMDSMNSDVFTSVHHLQHSSTSKAANELGVCTKIHKINGKRMLWSKHSLRLVHVFLYVIEYFSVILVRGNAICTVVKIS